jgi:PAS domain S-box-containing protein
MKVDNILSIFVASFVALIITLFLLDLKVLVSAIVFFGASAVLNTDRYANSEKLLFRWLAAGFALLAIGLTGVLLQKYVGSSIGWVGRVAQYGGCVFLMVGLLGFWRVKTTSGKSLETTCAEVSRKRTGEQEQVNEQFRQTMNELNILLDNAPIGIYKIIDRKQVSLNRKIEDLFKYPKEELEFQTTRKLYPSDEVYEKFVNDAYPVLSQGLVYETVQEFIRKDGVHFLARCIGKAVEPPDVSNGVIWLLEDVTDRMKTETALRESEKSLRFSEDQLLIAEQLGRTGSWFYDIETDKIWGSAEAFRIYGFPPVAGAFPLDEIEACIPERELVHQALVSLINEGQEYNFEYAIKPADGSPQKIILSIARLEKNVQGKPLRVVGFIQDITERKQLVKELQDSNRQYQALFEQSAEGIFIMSLKGEVLLVNKSFALMHGYASEEISGMSLKDLDTPESYSKMAERMQRILNGESLTFEVEHYHKDGHVFPLEVSTELISAGDDFFVQCLHRDITVRRRTEVILQARIRLSEYALTHSLDELLTKTLDEAEAVTGSTIGFFLFLDEDQQTVMLQTWSSNTLSTMSRCEVKGQHYPIDSAGVWVDCVLQRQPVIHNDYATLPHRKGMPQGHVTVVRELVMPIFRGDKIVAVIGIGNKAMNYDKSDIEAISQLANLTWDIVLGKRADQEKLVLEQQFQHAQKLESLGVLAGGIAHDFNNILAVIMCYSSLAQQMPEKAVEVMPEIEKAASRAIGLCRQMLSYSGKSELTLTQVKMTALIQDIVKMLRATIPKNAVIKTNLARGLPGVEGDAGQLSQVVMNLTINASEAIGEEQGEILISLNKKVFIAGQEERSHFGKIIPPGQYLCLEVTDTGCGMDDETKQKIFEPFFTTKFVGRGLGMSAVLGIITSHKGALQLSSQKGQGATFKVYLPVLIDEAAEKSAHHLPSSPHWKGNGTILLVEDEPQLIAVAKILLENLGFLVIEASNGIEALEQYRKNAAVITLVMTDIGMPLMSGYELIAELKKLDPEVPIIVSSGFSDKVVKSKIPPGVVAGFISKPYNFEKLREMLRGVVATHPDVVEIDALAKLL